MTRDEIMVLAELGEVEGVLHEKEAHLIRNIFLLHEITAGDISTPRAVIYAFQKDRPRTDGNRLQRRRTEGRRARR